MSEPVPIYRVTWGDGADAYQRDLRRAWCLLHRAHGLLRFTGDDDDIWRTMCGLSRHMTAHSQRILHRWSEWRRRGYV